MRMRQIALVAKELAPITALFQSVLGLHICHRDAAVGKWGLENALLPIGHEFIEVVAPIEDNTSAGRYLERRGGDGGYMVILQCDDGVTERQRISDLGVRVAYYRDQPPYHCTQYHPQDVGATLLEIDSMDNVTDHLAPNAHWAPAGDHWQSDADGKIAPELLGVALQSSNPEAMARNWERIIARPLSENAAGEAEIRLDDDRALRFIPDLDGRGDGLAELDIAVRDVSAILIKARTEKITATDRQIILCGMRINLCEGD